MKKLVLFFLLFILIIHTSIQAQEFNGRPYTLQTSQKYLLDSLFDSYEVFHLDFESINRYVETQQINFDLSLHINNNHWKFQMEAHPMSLDHAQIEVIGEDYISYKKPEKVFKYQGKQKNNDQVSRFFISQNNFSAIIDQANARWEIKSAKLLTELSFPKDVFIKIKRPPFNRLQNTADNLFTPGSCDDNVGDCSTARVFCNSPTPVQRYIEMAAIVDKAFYDTWKGVSCQGDECINNVIAKLSEITNQTSEIYEDYFDTEIVFSNIKIFESPDPYNTNPNNSLALMQTRWNTAFECIPRDVVVLFSGKNMLADGIFVGTNIPVIGTQLHLSYGIVECYTTEHLWHKTAAHELGHGLGAVHIDDLCPAQCAAPSGDDVLMCEAGPGDIDPGAFTKFNQCRIINHLVGSGAFEDFVIADCESCATYPEVFVDKIDPTIGCETDNIIEVTLRIYNSCSDEFMNSIKFSYKIAEHELITPTDFGDFESSINGGQGSRTLVLENITIPAEEIVDFKVRLRVIGATQNPNNLNFINSFNCTINFNNFNTTVGDVFNYHLVEVESVDGSQSPVNASDLNIQPLPVCAEMPEQELHIDGILIIDQDHCFYNSKLVMGPGAEIIILAGRRLTLENSKVFGCSQMWKGIDVQIGGELECINSVIKDAEKAVTLNSSALFESMSTRFENNYIGLYILESFNGQARYVGVNNFYGNRFESTATLLDPYPGQELYSSWAFAGIEAHDVQSLELTGGPGSSFLDRNFFYRVRNGIITHNTNLYLAKAEFNQINWFDSNPESNAIWAHGDGDDWIIQSGVNGTSHTYFDNCKTGIKAIGMNLTLYGNQIENTYEGISIQLSQNREVSVSENSIHASYVGINVYQCAPLNGSISENQIQIDGSPAYGVGIQINENEQFNSGWDIYNNELNIQSGRYGIFHRTGRRTAIRNNSISIEKEDNSLYSGIFAEGSPFIFISCNAITGNGQPAYSYFKGKGIYLKNSLASSVLCNAVNESNVGVQYWMNCTANRFSGNIIGQHKIGLLLGFYQNGDLTDGNVTFSQQTHTANEWKVLYQSNELLFGVGAVNLAQYQPGPDPVYPGSIIVDESENPFFFPTYEAFFDGWISNQPDELPSFNCNNRPVCENGIGTYRQGLDRPSSMTKLGIDSLMEKRNQSIFERIFQNTIKNHHTTFSASEISQLQAIAKQCPLTGGNVVLEARSLLSIVDSTDYDDFALCQNQVKSTNPEGYQQDNFLQVFPNPTNDRVTIKFTELPAQDGTLRLVNTQGQTLEFHTVYAGVTEAIIDLTKYPSGNYSIIYSSNEKQQVTKKIIKL